MSASIHSAARLGLDLVLTRLLENHSLSKHKLGPDESDSWPSSSDKEDDSYLGLLLAAKCGHDQYSYFLTGVFM